MVVLYENEYEYDKDAGLTDMNMNMDMVRLPARMQCIGLPQGSRQVVRHCL